MEKLILILKGAFATAIGLAAYLLGGFDALLNALVVVVILDWITGLTKAFVTKTMSSEVGRRGIGQKVVSLIVVALANIIQQVLGDAIPLREIVIMFFIANEGISLLENASAIGLPIPEKLQEALQQLHSKNKQ